MAQKRRSPQERLADLVGEKKRIEALIQQAQARTKEAKHKALVQRRAVLGAALEPYLEAPGEKGDTLRLLLASIPMKPRERIVLCGLPSD